MVHSVQELAYCVPTDLVLVPFVFWLPTISDPVSLANANFFLLVQRNHSVRKICRTGMLAMLMQLLVGSSDETIVDDYYQSNAEFVKRDTPTTSTTSNYEKSSAAASMILSRQRRSDRVRMDASVFRGTNRAAMETTLKGLRQRHGQNLDKYFDSIGFDNSWRKRFVAVLGLAIPTSRL